jgi:flagellin
MTFGGLISGGDVAMTIGVGGVRVQANVFNPTDLTALASAINGVSGTTFITASFATPGNKSLMTLTTADGRDIELVDFTHTGTTKTAVANGNVNMSGDAVVNDSIRKSGTVNITSPRGALTITNPGNTTVFAAGGLTSSFSSITSVDITTVAGATSALSAIDSALTTVNNSRASLGGLMNRFEATVSNQNTAISNLSASRSRILDTDYAVETTNLAKAQIIQQAATAMLAQANQSSQSVLALLK